MTETQSGQEERESRELGGSREQGVVGGRGGGPTLTRILSEAMGVWAWLPDGRDDIERARQEGPALSGDGPPDSGSGSEVHSEQPHAAYREG